MTKEIFTYLSSDNIHQIHAQRWVPEGELRGIVQLAHGMREFVDRYDAFATYLAAAGFLVVGNDHLGHGDSVEKPEDYGFFREPDGLGAALEDMHQLYLDTVETYPGLPYFFFGHSMGSFFTRVYLYTYQDPLAGAVICGTGTMPAAVLQFARFLCKNQAKKNGWHYRSESITNLAFGGKAYSRFEKAGDGTTWLSKNVENIQTFYKDHRHQFIFTLNGYETLFRSIYEAGQQQNVNRMNRELPLLLIAGDQDPVGNCGKGVRQVFGMYQKAGMKDITCKLYKDDRHEVLNELDRDVVMADVLAWLEVRC